MADRDLCGRTLGEFVLRERIDEDGSGAVYRGEQPLLGRDVVVKVLHQRHDADALQRFMREAQLASRLDHPYAAHVYAFGVEDEDGLPWIAMELVQGITLKRWLADARADAARTVRAVLRVHRGGGPGRARARDRTSRPEAIERDGDRGRGPSVPQAARLRDRPAHPQRCRDGVRQPISMRSASSPTRP